MRYLGSKMVDEKDHYYSYLIEFDGNYYRDEYDNSWSEAYLELNRMIVNSPRLIEILFGANDD